MQRALSFVHAARALQHARGWSPEVCHRLLHWHSHQFTAPVAHDRVDSAAGRPKVEAGSAREMHTTAQEAATVQPELPLCEREARYAVPLTELLTWQEVALQEVEAVGDTWAQQDEGPSAADLQTELGWLLDDSLAAWALAGGDWRGISWHQLERDLQRQELRDVACQCLVQLREPLEVLAAVWEQRLCRREPLQYLTSTTFWRDIVLSVGPGVLIPRPETELIIDFVQEAAAAAPSLVTGTWADLGTGSGALAVGVARALPQVHKVYAVDLSPVPLAYAAFNAERLGVAERVALVQGSWFEPVEVAGVCQLAGVVSNPPYICSTDMPRLQAEVGRHEPHLALHGGEGLGIDCLLPICTGAARLLQPGGFLALETAGGEQAHYIADLLSHMRCSALDGVCTGVVGITGGTGDGGSWGGGLGGASGERLAFADVRVRKDLRGVDRFVTASRAAAPTASDS